MTTVPSTRVVEIQTPADGSTLLQRADEATTAVVIIRGITREPSVELTLNGGYVTNGHAHLASGSDPFTWEFDAPIPPRTDGFHGHLVPGPGNLLIVDVNRWDDATRVTSTFSVEEPVNGDVRVVDMEVNQAVQEPGNGVPLIGYKRTVVRVFVAGRRAGSSEWGAVTGQLVTHRSDGSSHTYLPINGTTVATTARPDRYSSDSQLWFVLDRPDTAAGNLRPDRHHPTGRRRIPGQPRQ